MTLVAGPEGATTSATSSALAGLPANPMPTAMTHKQASDERNFIRLDRQTLPP
jgi:hypothetical protein